MHSLVKNCNKGAASYALHGAHHASTEFTSFHLKNKMKDGSFLCLWEGTKGVEHVMNFAGSWQLSRMKTPPRIVPMNRTRLGSQVGSSESTEPLRASRPCSLHRYPGSLRLPETRNTGPSRKSQQRGLQCEPERVAGSGDPPHGRCASHWWSTDVPGKMRQGTRHEMPIE